MEKGPKDAVLEWKWNIDGNEGLLWKVGDDPDVIAGHMEIWMTNAPYVLFRANQDATDGAVVHVTLKLWVKYYEMEQAKVSVGEGRANITIVPNAISIDFDYLPMIDLWDEDSASFSVMTVGLPAGDKVFVWNTTGNYGGFGNIWPSSVKSFESTSPWGYYSGNGNGADGDKDIINVSVYLVQGSDRQLLGNATATIEVYYPQTVYCLLDQDRSTGYIGSGSTWNMYVVGHGHLDWNGFYARMNDTIRIYCQYRGYVPDWEQKDIYLWQGTNKILLVTSAEIVTGMDKTFQITI
jgi:hypothetical protein